MIDAWIAIEETVAIAKDLGAINHIDDQEERSCCSQCRQDFRVD